MRVVQLYKTKWYSNPINGHEWSEKTYIDKWGVSGGQSNRIFNTAKGAEEWMNFLMEQKEIYQQRQNS